VRPIIQRHRDAAAIESLLFGLSVYAVPALILIVSVVALLGWEGRAATPGRVGLELRVLEDPPGSLGPAEALAGLAGRPLVMHHGTQLSESPFWLAFVARAGDVSAGATSVELPSRHAVQTRCWNATSLQPLGEASRNGQSGRLYLVKAGLAVDLGILQADLPLLCRATHAGPARISVQQWPSAQLADSAQQFQRNAGLLEGGLSVLALFVLVTAIINREWLYVLFAAWLVVSLRLGALSVGWDTQWFGREIPPQWLLLSRKVSMVAYYVLTVTMLGRLCGEELKRVGYRSLLRAMQWFGPLLLLAVALPYARFLPLLWAATGFSILGAIFLLTRVVIATRSRVAIWYSASLVITLFASFYEVIAAALGWQGLIGSVNHVSAALMSSLMAAFAIAEQMRQERQERLRAQTELRQAWEATPIGLFTLDASGVFTRTNPALREMLGLADGGGTHWGAPFERGAWPRLLEQVTAGKGHELELRGLTGPGGRARCFLVRAALASQRIEGSLQDITERVESAERLRFLAEHDALTGILNRRGIEKALSATLDARAADTTLSLAYIDLDRFKLINDLFGHAAGDEVLRQVCARIGSLLDQGPVFGRVGGDEFVIVFPSITVVAATEICRRIVEGLGSVPYRIGERAFQVKCSIGLVEVTEDIPVHDAISVADRACRLAKDGHQGNPVVFARGDGIFREREQELRLVERLSTPAAPDGLFVQMQPILSLRGPHDALDFEVLVRMRDADQRVVPASKVIAAAESNGRIAVIDRWVLSHTLDWLCTHHARLGNTRMVCVNLSGGSLNDERFVEDAFALLAGAGGAAHKLCIEITESVALHDLHHTRRFIDRVRGHGAKVALDDFGAGYTSFAYLKELPADALKIDGSFVRGVGEHAANRAITQAIVELARRFGMLSIAEWAEDAATVRALAEIGADYVQGYAIARPLEPDRLLQSSSCAEFIEDERLAAFARTLSQAQRRHPAYDHLVG
jgi:diguanylate cyclase (GGDEF)-like protein